MPSFTSEGSGSFGAQTLLSLMGGARFVTILSASLVTHTLTLSLRTQGASVTVAQTLGPGSAICLPSHLFTQFQLDALDANVFWLKSEEQVLLGSAQTVLGSAGVALQQIGGANSLGVTCEDAAGNPLPVGVLPTGGGTTFTATASGVVTCVIQPSGTALPTINPAGAGAQVMPPTYGPSMTTVVTSAYYLYRFPVIAGAAYVVANGVYVGRVVISTG